MSDPGVTKPSPDGAPQFDGWLLVSTAFLSSAAILTIEILAGRMLAPYVGMSIYSWTAIISTVLAGLSIGNWIGGRLSTPDYVAAWPRLAWLFFGGAVLTVAILFALQPVAGLVLGATDDALSAVLLLAGCVFLPPALIGGIPAPILTRAAIAADRTREGAVLGRIYAAGAAGAIAGSMATGFWLIPHLGTAASIAIAAAVQGGLALVWLLRGQAIRSAVGAMIALAAVGGTGLHRWQPFCDTESAYFCIRVVGFDTPDVNQSSVRALVLDHLVHGVNVQNRPEILLSPYLAQIHTITRAWHPAPQRAFFVGGGAYTLPRLWSQFLDVTVAEIDPAVTDIARSRMWVDTDAMTIRHRDARVALRAEPDASFDIIIGDAFKDVAAPFHLLTTEFAALIVQKLRPEGLYLLNLVDHPQRQAGVLAVRATLAQSFKTVAVWREDDPNAVSNRYTYVIAATNRPVGDPMMAATRRANWQIVTLPPIDRENDLVLTDDYAPLERLLTLYADTVD